MSPLRRSITLLRVFGFPIRIHVSWLVLLALVVYTLAGPGGLFREWPGLAQADGAVLWTLGLAGALGLVASLLAHELCHSIVAHYAGIPVRGITLFVFGGVSELEEEPPTPLAEFVMAGVGPLSSLLISMGFLGALLVGWRLGLDPRVKLLLGYLVIINMMLAVFNSIPAFPLDGGRVVRSLLWGATGDLYRATRWAARMGSAAGVVMIALGALMVLNKAFLPGVWMALIGFLIRGAASSSLQRVRLQRSLEGQVVGELMSPGPVAVPAALSLRRFVDEYVLTRRLALFPVVDEQGLLVGVAGPRDPLKVDRMGWDFASVADIMGPAAEDITIAPLAPAAQALSRLSTDQGKALVVVEASRPVGIVSLRDLLEFVALKTEFSASRGVRRNA